MSAESCPASTIGRQTERAVVSLRGKITVSTRDARSQRRGRIFRGFVGGGCIKLLKRFGVIYVISHDGEPSWAPSLASPFLAREACASP